ncbi:MAG: hypothetical protein JST04_03690 [Bdellovibrionales bacterium]|nr:hypothetical protein [Bdellovibrionales bacterium]
MPFTKYKLGLAVAGAGLLAASGCQFGNRTSTTLLGYDTISGYYASLPQTISFHAQIGTTAPRNQTGNVTQMPLLMKTIMANPTMLYFDDPVNGFGSIRSHANTGIGVPTIIDNTKNSYGASTSGSADVGGCEFKEEIINSGKYADTATTSVVAGYTVRGKLSLDYSVSRTFTGEAVDCTTLLTNMKKCYTDGVGCSSDDASVFYTNRVIDTFQPILDAGVATDAEIVNARELGYHATYE